MSTKITDHMLKGTSIRTLLQRAAAEAGFNLVDGSFEEGAVVTESNDVVWFRNEGTYYGWGGTIPVGGYIVPAGSTPSTAGGIGAGAWVDRTDVTLRSDLASESGSKLVGYQPVDTCTVVTTVQGKLREFVSVKDFGAKGDGATDDTAAIQAAFDWLQAEYDAGRRGMLFAPAGNYVFSLTLRLGNGARKDCELTFLGAGKGVTKFLYTGASDTNGLYIGQNTDRLSIESGVSAGTGGTKLKDSSIGGFSVARHSGTGGVGVLCGNIQDSHCLDIDVDGSWGTSFRVWGRVVGYGQCCWSEFDRITVRNDWTGATYGFLSDTEAASNRYGKIAVWTAQCKYPIAELGFWNTWMHPIIHETNTTSGNTRSVGGYYVAAADRVIFMQPECEVGFTGSQASMILDTDASVQIHQPIFAGNRFIYTGADIANAKTVFYDLEQGSTVVQPNIYPIGKKLALWNAKMQFSNINRSISVYAASIGVSGVYGSYITLLERQTHSSFLINSVRVINNTTQSIDFQFRSRNKSSTLSTNSIIKTVAAGASAELTNWELAQIVFDGTQTLNYTARLRTASESLTGTVDFWFGGIEFA